MTRESGYENINNQDLLDEDEVDFGTAEAFSSEALAAGMAVFGGGSVVSTRS